MIRPLPIERGGVVGIPEEIDDLFIRNHSGIEGDPDNFSMPGFPGANVLVSRMRILACGITAGNRGNTLLALINGLHAPKTAPPTTAYSSFMDAPKHNCADTASRRRIMQENFAQLIPSFMA